MRTFFTADHHFGHKNIIAFCKRPYRSVTAMDADLIAKWNAVVKPSDRVIHVGDFALSDNRPYLSQLNGEKHLWIGNHDLEGGRRANAASGWTTVNQMSTIVVEEVRVTLCHYAMRVWPGKHYGALHFFGHSHGNMNPDGQSCDVGVDCWDYQPVTLKQIKFFLATQRPTA